MKHILHLLIFSFLLTFVSQTCFALIALDGMTKDSAETELGVVMKREFIGLGPPTNQAGISIEFAPKGKLEGFLFVTLDIYLERPNSNEHPVTHYRRLTSVTLKPLVQTREKVQLFFTVDSQYLDRTDIAIRVNTFGKSGPHGYSISLNPKDFPPPKANNAGEPTRALPGAGGLP